MSFFVCLTAAQLKHQPPDAVSSSSILIFTDLLNTQEACSNLLAQKTSGPRLNVHLHMDSAKKYGAMVAEFQVGTAHGI